MIRNSRRMVTLAVAGAVAIAPVITGCGAGEEPQSASPTQLTDGVNVSVPKDKPAEAQIALRNMFVLGPRPGEAVSAGLSLPLYGVLINQVKGRPDRLVSVSSPNFGGPGQIDGGGLALPGAAADGTGAVVKLLGKPAQPPAPAQPAKKPAKKPGGAPTGQPSGEPGATSEPTGAGATPEPTTGGTAAPQTGNQPAVPGGQPAAPGGDQPLVVLPSLKQELLPGSTVPVRMEFEKAGAIDFQVPIIPQQDEFATYPLPTPVAQPPAPGSATPGSPQSPGGGSPTPTASTEPGQPGVTASPTTSESPGAGH